MPCGANKSFPQTPVALTTVFVLITPVGSGLRYDVECLVKKISLIRFSGLEKLLQNLSEILN
jgi:hypothetical protein